MTHPTFSAISDLYSPTQLQRALYEASQIAFAMMACYMEETPPTRELLDTFMRLRDAGDDAMIEYAVSMKRTAPKDVARVDHG